MSDRSPFEEKLIDYIEDAHALEQHVKVARDGYTAEHLEIAAYELLERVAERAGDDQTAEVARLNRAHEEAMAAKIAASWDLALDMSFEQEGLKGAPPMGDPGLMAGAEPPEPGTAR